MMLKKTITYKDLDGNPITEDFYFNLNKAEIAKMELSKHGGLSSYLKQIVAAEDGESIINTFEEILVKSFGKRNEDNKGFTKSPELSAWFLGTDAYSELFMELVTDADSGAAFIVGIVPEGLVDSDKPVIPALTSVQPFQLPKTEAVRTMTIEEMQAAIAKAHNNNL